MKRTAILALSLIYTLGAHAECDRAPRKVDARWVSVEPRAAGLHGDPEAATSQLLVKIKGRLVCAVTFAAEQRDEMRENLKNAHAFLAQARKAGSPVIVQGDQLGTVKLAPAERHRASEPAAEAARDLHT